MWPFTKKSKSVDSVVVTDIPICPSISPFVRGLGFMVESNEYNWTSLTSTFSSHFECVSEDISITLDYNCASMEYELKSKLFTLYGDLKDKEKDYLIEKLRKRFPNNVIDKRQEEKDKQQQKFEKISSLGK